MSLWHKSRGLRPQFRIREKGTDVWLDGYVDGTPFYSREKALTWLRKEAKSHARYRDQRFPYNNDLTKADVAAECDRYEIVEMVLKAVDASAFGYQPFGQQQIDTYKDGFMTFGNSTDPRWYSDDNNPYQTGIQKDWWRDGYVDAYYLSHDVRLVYPELAGLL